MLQGRSHITAPVVSAQAWSSVPRMPALLPAGCDASHVGVGITTCWDVVRTAWNDVLKDECLAMVPVVPSDLSTWSVPAAQEKGSPIGHARAVGLGPSPSLGWSLTGIVVPDGHPTVLSNRLPLSRGESHP